MRQKQSTDTSNTDSFVPGLGFGLSIMSAVQQTSQTLYNFWFALWLVAKVKINGCYHDKERSTSKYFQETKQSGIQCILNDIHDISCHRTTPHMPCQ